MDHDPGQIDVGQLGLDEDDREAWAAIVQQNIRKFAPRRTGYGAGTIEVDMSQGEGFEVVAEITMVDYMEMLNRGYEGFIMRGLIGKTIPIKLPGGQTIYRKATEENVGRHQITARDESSGRIMRGNKPYAWRHPGVKARRFVEQGIAESKRQGAELVLRAILRGTVDQVNR